MNEKGKFGVSDDSDCDLEESFRPTSKRRGKSRTIVDSESEEDVSGRCSSDNEEESDVVDDSFGDEDRTAVSLREKNRRTTPINKLKIGDTKGDSFESSNREEETTRSNTDVVESTDDEDDLRPTNGTTKRDDDSFNRAVVTPEVASDEGEGNGSSSNEIRRNSPSRNSSLHRDIVDSSDDHEEGNDDEGSNARRQDTNETSDDLIEIIENSLSIVEVSSGDENPSVTLKQSDIKSFMTRSDPTKVKREPRPRPKTVVSEAQFQDQTKKICSIEADLSRAKNALRVIKLENLPDKGRSILDKEKALNKLLDEERRVLAEMVVDKNKKNENLRDKIEVAWDQIEAGVDAVGPRTFGRKGVARFNVEKQLAIDTLDHLHKSLDTCPTENDFVDDPKGLRVELMAHQQRALAWLLWRERQKPSGGLLADDMGLGKTLTIISLILKSRELEADDDPEQENRRGRYSGGTLVVCPASLLNQWSGEIERRCKRGLLDVEVYHGTKRETKPKRLAKHDVVVTTYALVLNENARDGALFGVRWRRIVIDEAHQIRNHKSQTSEAVFGLAGRSRWALTGTPVHNKELDMYAILKFLRCSPFDDLQVWKHWVADKSTGGDMRLHAVISSLMLRRTKAELMENGTLLGLPSRTWELVPVKLHKDEMDVYQKVLVFSRTLFAQFLHQRAEKNQDAADCRFNGASPDANGEYFKMRNKLLKLNRVKEIRQHEILVLLLRLRQICCHPSLINQMLQGDEDLGNANDEEESEELNLLEQLNKLNIHEDDDNNHNNISQEAVGLKEASKGYLNPSNPVFRADRRSSKVKALIDILKNRVSGEDKVVVVSQWTSLLDLIATQLEKEGVPYDSLNGKVPVNKRSPIVDNFNDPRSQTKVLLLSLTAGGVGLNLVGANNLFLLDLHWNPQLESQAQDRIYRVGQKKPIHVYKFMAEDTIEERIKALQEKKLDVADSMLTGSKRVGSSKLSLQDLKMLFDLK